MTKTRTELRADLVEISGGVCEWPGCKERMKEMAHIHGIGMGGRRSADVLPNVAGLCRYHHDLLDGREKRGLRYELGELLGVWVDTKRSADGWVNE